MDERRVVAIEHKLDPSTASWSAVVGSIARVLDRVYREHRGHLRVVVNVYEMVGEESSPLLRDSPEDQGRVGRY